MRPGGHQAYTVPLSWRSPVTPVRFPGPAPDEQPIRPPKYEEPAMRRRCRRAARRVRQRHGPAARRWVNRRRTVAARRHRTVPDRRPSSAVRAGLSGGRSDRRRRTRSAGARPHQLDRAIPEPRGRNPRGPRRCGHAPGAQATDAAGTPGSPWGVVPDVVCLNLQHAQDSLQGAGFVNLTSRGRHLPGRLKVVDRNWVVIAHR